MSHDQIPGADANAEAYIPFRENIRRIEVGAVIWDTHMYVVSPVSVEGPAQVTMPCWEVLETLDEDDTNSPLFLPDWSLTWGIVQSQNINPESSESPRHVWHRKFAPIHTGGAADTGGEANNTFANAPNFWPVFHNQRSRRVSIKRAFQEREGLYFQWQVINPLGTDVTVAIVASGAVYFRVKL